MIPRAQQFDYRDERRGVGAVLVNEAKHTVVVSEWPETLMAMLRVNGLRGAALVDAEAELEAYQARPAGPPSAPESETPGSPAPPEGRPASSSPA